MSHGRSIRHERFASWKVQLASFPARCRTLRATFSAFTSKHLPRRRFATACKQAAPLSSSTPIHLREQHSVTFRTRRRIIVGCPRQREKRNNQTI